MKKHYVVLVAAGLGFLLFLGLFVAGVLLLSTYTIPFQCPTFSTLKPGAQGSCNRSAGDLFYSAEVASVNGTSSLVTYVFNKQPKRFYVNQDFNFTLNDQSLFFYDIPLVAGAEYKWKIDVDEKMDILIRTSKYARSGATIYYQVKSVAKDKGSFIAEKSDGETYLELVGWYDATGTFNVSVKWPQWDVTSVKPVEKCTGSPCEWKFADTLWGAADTDLWIVTVNNGTKPYDVAMYLRNDPAIWITVPVIMIVLGFVCLIGGFFVSTILND